MKIKELRKKYIDKYYIYRRNGWSEFRHIIGIKYSRNRRYHIVVKTLNICINTEGELEVYYKPLSEWTLEWFLSKKMKKTSRKHVDNIIKMSVESISRFNKKFQK